MDEDYTYDEMCPEEAEFIHYEGGESFAEGSSYADDYAHHSVMGQPNFNGDNTDFVHHAALYGAYLASRECNQRRNSNVDKTKTSANSSYSTKSNTEDNNAGCIILTVLIIVVGVIISIIV